mgnify:CR=1 FL=1
MCNITEAPPVADEARRCWRKTRSIAPASRAIGDYVLRGLNGLRSKTHEPVLFERSEFTGECAERPTESRKLCTAARHCGGARGETSSLPFLCRRFFFQTEKKCRNAGSVKSLIIVGREGSKTIINKSKLLYRLSPISDSREGCPYKLHSNKIVQISRADNTRPKQLCRFIILQ